MCVCVCVCIFKNIQQLNFYVDRNCSEPFFWLISASYYKHRMIAGTLRSQMHVKETQTQSRCRDWFNVDWSSIYCATLNTDGWEQCHTSL